MPQKKETVKIEGLSSFYTYESVVALFVTQVIPWAGRIIRAIEGVLFQDRRLRMGDVFRLTPTFFDGEESGKKIRSFFSRLLLKFHRNFCDGNENPVIDPRQFIVEVYDGWDEDKWKKGLGSLYQLPKKAKEQEDFLPEFGAGANISTQREAPREAIGKGFVPEPQEEVAAREVLEGEGEEEAEEKKEPKTEKARKRERRRGMERRAIAERSISYLCLHGPTKKILREKGIETIGQLAVFAIDQFKKLMAGEEKRWYSIVANLLRVGVWFSDGERMTRSFFVELEKEKKERQEAQKRKPVQKKRGRPKKNHLSQGEVVSEAAEPPKEKEPVIPSERASMVIAKRQDGEYGGAANQQSIIPLQWGVAAPFITAQPTSIVVITPNEEVTISRKPISVQKV